jgi:acetyl-CoA carboxylase biotin carboxylase subunit
MPIKKVLIANRGEIACRIIRTCRAKGVATVAVYSEADALARHVRLADEAVAIGPPPAKDSYLSVEKILAAAKTTGADAVHPGYGFLSENAGFAEACQAAGIVFIGPSPHAIRVMGTKTSARAAMIAAGVPVVPGNNGSDGNGFADLDEARAAADEMGYPVMLKAAAGGGGRGMRLVESEDKLESALEAARREAGASFGDDAVYMEKAITRARHIEVQIFGDTHGNVVHLFERDCSVQRRNQKVIEEAPSPALDETLRKKMYDVAVAAGRSVDYVGAGTVEMLFDAVTKEFYFLEMNTRLQVEHPVTELICGLDLVDWQLRVAEGQPLPLVQEAIVRRGHAIECRIYAEDAIRFLPSPGTITHLLEPNFEGVRNDSGVESGTKITVYYDPMISKLCTFGASRDEAISRMREALDGYEIEGIKTNLAFHRLALIHPKFVSGDYDTGFIAENKEALTPPKPSLEQKAKAAAVAAVAATADKSGNTDDTESSTKKPSEWQRAIEKE